MSVLRVLVFALIGVNCAEAVVDTATDRCINGFYTVSDGNANSAYHRKPNSKPMPTAFDHQGADGRYPIL